MSPFLQIRSLKIGSILSIFPKKARRNTPISWSAGRFFQKFLLAIVVLRVKLSDLHWRQTRDHLKNGLSEQYCQKMTRTGQNWHFLFSCLRHCLCYVHTHRYFLFLPKLAIAQLPSTKTTWSIVACSMSIKGYGS